jgi:hypothetical protein
MITDALPAIAPPHFLSSPGLTGRSMVGQPKIPGLLDGAVKPGHDMAVV